MGLGYDCGALLLCGEDIDSTSLSSDDGDDGGIDVWVMENPGEFVAQSWDLSMAGDVPLQSDEFIADLMARESEHLPRDDFVERLLTGAVDPSIRRDAIDWIAKVHTYYSFGPLTAYLSINYLNRFLSCYELPKGKAWTTQLLSVACLTLAAKMEETVVPLSLDLQVGEAKYVFEARTIQRMELLVLTTLKWRMQAVTPFSYIDYFLQKLNCGNPPSKCSVARAAELILSTTRGIDFLDFKPSEIAMAVALSTLGESQIGGIDMALSGGIDMALSSSILINKDNVLRCFDAILGAKLARNLTYNLSPSISSQPHSPVGVLEAASISYMSELTTMASQTTFYTSQPCKRRKLDMVS